MDQNITILHAMLKNKNIAVLIVIMNKCSAVAEMGGRLATIDMGRKLGAVPLLGEELGFHLTQCRLGRGLSPYQVAS